MNENTPVVEFNNVNKWYGEYHALKDINFSVHTGEIVVVCGPSGSGKSTLIRCINHLESIQEGELSVFEQPANSKMQKPGKVGMVFQHFHLFPHLTVLENLTLAPIRTLKLSKQEAEKRAMQYLKRVNIEEQANKYPIQLSGGQQQRVGLARALCKDAEILLMDEAFSALDPLIRSEMQDQLIELQEKLHKTIIFITHDLDEALRLGDRIAILKDGELVQQGTPDEILLHPADDYVEAFVKDVNRARALTVETVMSPQTNRISANTIQEAIAQMKGFKQDYAYHVTEDGYQGVLTKEGLLDAAKEDTPQDEINQEIYEEVPAISPDAAIEEILVETMSCDYSLPVVDDEGNLQGELERSAVAEIFSDNSEEDTPPSPKLDKAS